MHRRSRNVSSVSNVQKQNLRIPWVHGPLIVPRFHQHFLLLLLLLLLPILMLICWYRCWLFFGIASIKQLWYLSTSSAWTCLRLSSSYRKGVRDYALAVSTYLFFSRSYESASASASVSDYTLDRHNATTALFFPFLCVLRALNGSRYTIISYATSFWEMPRALDS